MAVRIIEYTLSAQGVSPADMQFGGTAGDHNATCLKFKFDDNLNDIIAKKAQDAQVVYHFESYDSLGKRKIGDVINLNSEPITFHLENALTKAGGTICVYLAISSVQDDNTLMLMYSYPIYLNLASKQTTVNPDGDFEAMPTMAAMVKQRTQDVLSAADRVAVAAAQTLSAATNLSRGSEFIFLGGDAKSAVDIKLTVDDTLSTASDNPIINRVVATEIENLKNSKQDKVDIAELKAQLFSMCYPVGSYYFSANATNPKNLFGGEWEQVKDRFILACGDTHNIGETGGRETVRLSAAIGATGNDIYSLGYVSSHMSSFQSQHAPSYVLWGDEVSDTHKSWNHSVPVTEHSNTEWDTNIMPPFEAAYCWKRVG